MQWLLTLFIYSNHFNLYQQCKVEGKSDSHFWFTRLKTVLWCLFPLHIWQRNCAVFTKCSKPYLKNIQKGRLISTAGVDWFLRLNIWTSLFFVDRGGKEKRDRENINVVSLFLSVSLSPTPLSLVFIFLNSPPQKCLNLSYHSKKCTICMFNFLGPPCASSNKDIDIILTLQDNCKD